jgi:hypothetical protein
MSRTSGLDAALMDCFVDHATAGPIREVFEPWFDCIGLLVVDVVGA